MPLALYAVLLVALLAIGLGVRTSVRARRHRRKRRQAQKAIAKINAFEHPGQRIAYLRKIDPFAFEELLLDAFERQGYEDAEITAIPALGALMAWCSKTGVGTLSRPSAKPASSSQTP